MDFLSLGNFFYPSFYHPAMDGTLSYLQLTLNFLNVLVCSCKHLKLYSSLLLSNLCLYVSLPIICYNYLLYCAFVSISIFYLILICNNEAASLNLLLFYTQIEKKTCETCYFNEVQIIITWRDTSTPRDTPKTIANYLDHRGGGERKRTTTTTTGTKGQMSKSNRSYYQFEIEKKRSESSLGLLWPGI